MSGANSFGTRFVLTSFGESHGTALGAVIDGAPAGVVWRDDVLLNELARRRPGSSQVVSARAEADAPEILSGVFEGRTLGTPIAVIVRSQDARSADYAEIAKSPRPGHADDVWREKFGHVDPRGGGRSSGRETVARVIGGAVARMTLAHLAPELAITGFAREIGPFALDERELAQFKPPQRPFGLNPADAFTARFPSQTRQAEVEKLLTQAKSEGRSYGGLAEIWIDGAPKGLGQPVFHKLKADLAAAIMSVGAVSGFEIGAGFTATKAEGSQLHASLADAKGDVYGGIRGGVSTGERIVVRAAFKPTSSVLDVAKKGRHDPCIVPRAIPVLEAMVALVLVDHALWARTDRVTSG